MLPVTWAKRLERKEPSMTLTASNLVAWHDQTSSEHVEKRDDFAKKGFRPLSISVYGTPASPRYAAVMVKRPKLIATKSVIDKTQAQYQQVFDDMAANGYGPFLITATGPKNSALFAGSFRKMSKIPLTRSNLSKAEFIALNAEQHDKGAILVWADSFGSPSEPRYCAIWGPNPDKVAWNIDAVDEGGETLQQRFEAMRSMGARPALLSVTPAGRIMELFVDSQIGKWHSQAGMTSAQYQQAFNKQAKAGRWPICVSAAGSGSNTRFAAIFATREELTPRVYSVNGTPAVAAIDAKLEQYVRAQNLRGAALAIAHGRRLVYARGYTHAEAGYPDVKATTPFRQASISKTFAAVAAWKLIEQGKLTLDTTMQSVLGLTQPNGQAPKDSRFGNVRVRHLLTSTSGIGQGGVWRSVEASQAAGGTLPSNGLEVARWIAAQDMTGTPGDVKTTVYGNTDYYLLSLIVAAKANTATFEQALKKLVLDPLGMKHTRGSRSLADAQLADEARYHMTVHDPDAGWKLFQLECGASDRHEDRRLVPAHYGTIDLEMFDGCGGVSSSVVDVARLCAMFSCRHNNPVLKPQTIDDMLAAAIDAANAASGVPKAHGYHGMDTAWVVNAEQNNVAFKKGGWLPAMGASFVATTGGFAYVLAKNGNTPAGVDLNWLESIKPVVQAHDWGTKDRFPDFGLASLPGPLSAVAIDIDVVVDKLPIRKMQRLVQDAMARDAGRASIRRRPRQPVRRTPARRRTR
jgi:CubicO group peptidase (beta-lactamase class C family)